MSYDPERFVDKPHDLFICQICSCVFKNCIKTNCGHRYCWECFQGCLSHSEKCAFCRKEIDLSNCKPDDTVNEFVPQFKVYCDNKDLGCKWTGELRDVEKHVASCDYKKVKCPHLYCNDFVCKIELEKHMQQCNEKHKNLITSERVEAKQKDMEKQFSSLLGCKRRKKDPDAKDVFTFKHDKNNPLFVIGGTPLQKLAKRKQLESKGFIERVVQSYKQQQLTEPLMAETRMKGRKVLKANRPMITSDDSFLYKNRNFIY